MDTSGGNLTPLQSRLVEVLADLSPAWVLTGGAALVGFHLVADLVPSVEEPATYPLGASCVRVDTAHEILVDKLCALLGRMEIRDLADVRHLLQAGGDIDQAAMDAPRKDGGFSPLVLAWVLNGMPAARLAEAAGWMPDDAAALTEFKDGLVARLLSLSAPGNVG